MPTFELESDEPVQIANPVNAAPKYATIANDTSYRSRKMLLTHVAGMRWRLKKYWSQYVALDNDVSSQSLDREAVYQQYLEINDFEMRVSSPLDVTQDEVSREFTLTGTATTYAGFIPNVGDMFLADVGDGRDALFTLTSAEKKSFLMDAVYEVNYDVVDYNTAEKIADLKSKSIKTVYFVKDFLTLGKESFLVESEYNSLNNIREWLERLPREYIKEFFVEEYATILVPDQEETLYDPFMAKFVYLTMSTHRVPEYAKFKQLNCDTGSDTTYQTLLDSFLNKDERSLDFVVMKLKPTLVKGGKPLARYATVHYSGIMNVMYPEDDEKLGRYTPVALEPSTARVFNRPIDLDIAIYDSTLEGISHPDGLNITSMKAVTVDDYYILSKAFYEQDRPNMSAIELMLSNYYTGAPLDYNMLLTICRKSVYWGKLERFYYLPLLHFLLFSAQGDVN